MSKCNQEVWCKGYDLEAAVLMLEPFKAYGLDDSVLARVGGRPAGNSYVQSSFVLLIGDLTF